MPELPEVETLCRQMGKTVVGTSLLSIRILDDKLAGFPSEINRRVVSVTRRGKNLLLSLEDGRTLGVHLRMTGRLLWQDGAPEPPRYTRAVMAFPHGRIWFVDPRRFMTLAWERTSPAKCGPEPLGGVDSSFLAARGRNRKCPIKSLLLDQSVIAGIGNIYACEILHLAGIDPARPAGSLDMAAWSRLTTAIGSILDKAVSCRGTSISDWRDFHGQKGAFQNELRVYQRAGLPCPRCGEIVARISLGGRGTYFCPGCQR